MTEEEKRAAELQQSQQQPEPQQPVATPAQPAAEQQAPAQPQSQPPTQPESPDVDWQKRYSDSSREALKLKEEKEKVEQLLSVIEDIYKDNKPAYETFREGLKTKTGHELPDYETAYNKPKPTTEPTQNPTQQAPQQPQQAAPTPQQPSEENSKAFGEYWDYYPDMKSDQYKEGTPEYAEKAEKEAKVVEIANILQRTKGLTGGKALIRAHQIIDDEDAAEIAKREEQARLKGMSDAVQKNQYNSSSNSGGSQGVKPGIEVTDEDRKIAAASKTKLTPEKVAALRLKGLIKI